MKKLTFTIALLLFAVIASAQTAGVIIQPEFNTSNVRKGLFAEATIYKSFGLYADYKVLKNHTRNHRNYYNQLNAGISFKVSNSLKLITSTSVINKKSTDVLLAPMKDYIIGNPEHQGRVNQFLVMYSASIFSIAGGFETGGEGNKVTIGLGFNFK